MHKLVICGTHTLKWPWRSLKSQTDWVYMVLWQISTSLPETVKSQALVFVFSITCRLCALPQVLMPAKRTWISAPWTESISLMKGIETGSIKLKITGCCVVVVYLVHCHILSHINNQLVHTDPGKTHFSLEQISKCYGFCRHHISTHLILFCWAVDMFSLLASQALMPPPQHTPAKNTTLTTTDWQNILWTVVHCIC